MCVCVVDIFRLLLDCCFFILYVLVFCTFFLINVFFVCILSLEMYGVCVCINIQRKFCYEHFQS